MKKFLWLLAGLAALELSMKALKNRTKPRGYGEIIRTPKGASLPQRVNFVSKNITQKNTKHSWNRFFKDEPVAVALIGLAITMVVFQSGMHKFSNYFEASTIEWEQTTEPFNGAVFPIETVPNWVALSDQERTFTFDQLSSSKKIALPAYNLSAMRIGMTWRRDNELERNTYITYPVPNLGNYQLDATENSGSHTGLDIKTLIGTPVRAMSRGTVIKSENQPTGFGQFILILHTDVPDPENPEQITNLYSVYAHLDSRSVSAGDRVEKGQYIGKTGMSGMATAPHLHFQIDRPDAPFHPYWPFSWKDLQNNNINSYFEAVKQGLHADRAKLFTVHPINLVASTLNYNDLDPNLIVSADPTFVPKATDTPEPKEKIVVSIPKRTTQPSLRIDDSTASVVKTYTEHRTSTGRRVRLQSGEKLKVETDRTFSPGSPEVFDIIISDETLVASAGIEIGTTLNDIVSIHPQVLTKNDFKNGVAQVQVTTESSKTFKLIATSDAIGEIRSKSVRAQVFTDVSSSHKNKEAITFVKEKKIMNGYGDGSFKPNEKLNRAEAVKILISANELALLPAETNFSDVELSAWYTPYIATALARGLVKGYGNGLFRPGNTISRAEFLKIAIEADGMNIPTNFNKPYPDVETDAWFAPYFSIATQHDLLPAIRGGNIAPQQAITRSEASNIIWKLLQIH